MPVAGQLWSPAGTGMSNAQADAGAKAANNAMVAVAKRALRFFPLGA